MHIGSRRVGPDAPPLVIAEIGINHEGDVDKAIRMVCDAAKAGCECVKIQTHVIDDEMVRNDVIPGNARESIWDIMSRCALSEEEERRLMDIARELGVTFLSTPFSRAAADRLQAMGVPAFKIGSGECNNYPLVQHIAAFGKPVIVSTGMNDIDSIRPTVDILRDARVPFALLHCTSMYPTPYDKVRLGALAELGKAFPDAVLGLSDHSLGIYTSLAAVALGARIVEKHFTSDMGWPGPDIPISIDPAELSQLVRGVDAVAQALGGSKEILPDESPTIAFAYASVVTISPIAAGDEFSMTNLWVKRPGTGEIRAKEFSQLLGRRASTALEAGVQLRWADVMTDA